MIAAVVIVGAGSFYGGMRYANAKAPTGANGQQRFANLTPEERAARQQQFGAAGARPFGGGANRGGTGVTAGEIINKDDKSITVKMMDGGSKIIFFSDATQIMKSTAGSPSDLTVGQQILATGTPNQDGSLTAQSLQLRPAMQSQPGPQTSQ